MPNWVKNIIHIEGSAEDVAKAIDLMRDKQVDGRIDFNNIIPMPKRLDILSSSLAEDYVAVYLKTLSEAEKSRLQEELAARPVGYYGNYLKKYEKSFTMDISEDGFEYMWERLPEYESISPASMEDVGKAYIDNILEYGADTWYDWCWDNWGTKWNACECVIGDDYLEFDTAWSEPGPVISALSKKFPELTFYHEWADENIGYNCGKYEFRNGETIADKCFESDDEAREFACMVWGYGPDDFDD